jgi:hypothetical protein
MPAQAERSPRRHAGRAILAAVVVLAAMPAYLALSPPWQPIAVRLACAATVIAGCLRLLRRARSAMEAAPLSPLDRPPLPAATPDLDARFLALRDDVTHGMRSRRYFDRILWPRLSRIAGTDLPRPPEGRSLRRRGPSMSALARLVTEIERGA